MTTTVIEPTPPEASTPTPVETLAPKRKRKRPSFGLIFACTFLGLLTFFAIFADYLPFIRYPDEKVPGPDGRPGRYEWGPGFEAWFVTDGISNDVYFSSTRLSLLDRGVIMALAHIRGGSDLGRQWYLTGKLEHKANTFSDFIACALKLIAEGLTTTDQLIIEGGSAGGFTTLAAL